MCEINFTFSHDLYHDRDRASLDDLPVSLLYVSLHDVASLLLWPFPLCDPTLTKKENIRC